MGNLKYKDSSTIPVIAKREARQIIVLHPTSQCLYVCMYVCMYVSHFCLSHLLPVNFYQTTKQGSSCQGEGRELESRVQAHALGKTVEMVTDASIYADTL